MDKYTFRRFLLFGSIVIVIAIIFGGEFVEYNKLNTIKDVKVISTSTVMHVEGDAHDTYSRYTYYVNTDKGVFEISPEGLFASKVFGALKNDSIYTITTRGFDFPQWGFHPHIIDAN